jgi:YD repeat-containing protein
VVTTYDNRVNDWLIGLPLTTQVSSFAVGTSPPPEPRLTAFVHDLNGLLSTVNVEPNHAELWRSTRYVRNGDGVVTQVVASATGELSRNMFVYSDDERVFPRWVANDSGHFRWLAYHPAHGVLVGSMDPNGVKSTLKYDGFGRIRSVQPDGGALVQVSYEADDRVHLGHPRGIAVRADDSGGGANITYHDELGRVVEEAERGFDGQWIHNETRFDMFGRVADKLGRRTSLDDPGQDVAKTFEYNGFGEVLYDTDALDQTIYWRDLLGRVFAKQDADGLSEYVWDQGPHALGKLSSTTSADGTKTEHLYDQFGRAAETAWHVGGEKFTVSTEYDPLGRVDRILYPEVPGRSRYWVKNAYNASNYLDVVVDGPPGTTISLWQVLGRNVDGALSKSKLVNGIVSERGYNPQTGRLETVKTTAGAANYSLEYTYDPNGNVSDRIDTVNGRKETFTHDALDRLKTWKLDTSGGVRATLYDYDDLGNLTHAYLNGQLQDNNIYAGNGKPHALTDGSLGAFFYDSKGRQRNGGGCKIDYTAFDLPRAITQAGKTTSFDYDASNQRVRKTVGGDSTVYIAGLYERRTVGTSILPRASARQ